jgi:N,N-dimethylformamidase
MVSTDAPKFKPYFASGEVRVLGKSALTTHRWYHLTVRLRNGALGMGAVSHHKDLGCHDKKTESTDPIAVIPSTGPLFFATNSAKNNHFNGKISDPCVFDFWLDDTECDLLKNDISGAEMLQFANFAWGFGQDIPSQVVRGMTGSGNHGTLSQLPVRIVTGPHWFGETDNPSENPRSYAAIHFHEDSLSDTKWDPDFALNIPDDWASGLYAAKLVAGNEIDHLPFAVLPSRGTTTANVAFLLSTFTFLAYGNELRDVKGLNSIYDSYVDGSGVPFASLLQPLANFRPRKGILVNTDGEALSQHLNADLFLLRWFAKTSIEVDVLSDHDLHREGAELLEQYKVVATGSHPEYASSQMLDGIEGFLKIGGNLMYPGGNGFCWVTDLSNDGNLIEVRKPMGTHHWTSEPGEARRQFSGDIGGLWRARGRPPQKLTGVGFAAQGWTAHAQCGLARPYAQSEARDDPRFADLFDGIDKKALIGDFLSLGLGRGAAGDEIDRADDKLGTPPQAVILGSATGFSVEYQQAIEERCQIESVSLQQDDANIRADLVWFDTSAGGAVFSAGSINWISCLTHNDCNNNVSTLTNNVLSRMLKTST